MITRKGNLLPVIIIILAIAATVGVYAYSVWPTVKELSPTTVQVRKKHTIKNINSVLNTNTVANTNTTADATKDWKTYDNKTYHVAFKYPADWKVSEGSINTPYKIDVYPSQSSGWSTSGAITLWIDNSYSLRCGENPITKTSNTVIGGIPATLYVVSDTKVAACKYRSYILGRTPEGWKHSRVGDYSEIQVMSDNQGSFSIQDDILDTLTLSDPTADWKTYRNSKYGFTLKYPATWGKQEVDSTSLDGKPLIFTEFYENTANNSGRDGTLVISYKNSPALFQDGKWDSKAGSITSVGGRTATSTVYTPDPSIVGASPKEKIDFTVEPSTWVNRGTAKDVNGNTYKWGNGDIQLLTGSSGNFDTLSTILSTLTFTQY